MSHDSRPLGIELVCLGNICRSPMAHVVLESRLHEAGIADVEVTSSGTSGWHDGKPMDARAAATLSQAGYDPSRHRARYFSTDTYQSTDIMLAMDRSNYTTMLERSPTVDDSTRVLMFRSFDPEATETDNEVPDPYYGSDDGFTHVLKMIERTVDEIINRLPDLRELPNR